MPHSLNALTLSFDDLHQVMGLGIAGNFAGHLEQAGETPDFIQVKTDSNRAPKGLFPFFIPNATSHLGVFPLSSSEIHYPKDLATNAHLQAEPEVSVLFNIHYEFGKIVDMQPIAFSAFNDCSIRKPGAKKISDKKNWGTNTKGVSANFLPLTSLNSGSELDTFRIASYLKRDNVWHCYGNDSAVTSYSYFHQALMEWMQDKLNHQADFGPLENLNQLIHNAGFPNQLLISLGATTYTEFGEQVFLEPGDELAVYVYDSAHIDLALIEQNLKNGQALPAGKVSQLKQIIV